MANNKEGCGVVCMPIWTHISVVHYVFPLLHEFLRITNNAIDRFMMFCNVRVLQLNQEQLNLLLDTEVANSVLESKIIEKDN